MGWSWLIRADITFDGYVAQLGTLIKLRRLRRVVPDENAIEMMKQLRYENSFARKLREIAFSLKWIKCDCVVTSVSNDLIFWLHIGHYYAYLSCKNELHSFTSFFCTAISNRRRVSFSNMKVLESRSTDECNIIYILFLVHFSLLSYKSLLLSI